MKISALIAELQKLQALHGDLPVTRPNWQDGEDFPDHEAITEVYECSCGDLPTSHIHLS